MESHSFAEPGGASSLLFPVHLTLNVIDYDTVLQHPSPIRRLGLRTIVSRMSYLTSTGCYADQLSCKLALCSLQWTTSKLSSSRYYLSTHDRGPACAQRWALALVDPITAEVDLSILDTGATDVKPQPPWELRKGSDAEHTLYSTIGRSVQIVVYPAASQQDQHQVILSRLLRVLQNSRAPCRTAWKLIVIQF